MEKVFDKVQKYWKRIWFSAIGGFGVGFMISLFTSLFTDNQINGILMLFIITAGAVGAWFVLENNKDFKK